MAEGFELEIGVGIEDAAVLDTLWGCGGLVVMYVERVGEGRGGRKVGGTKVLTRVTAWTEEKVKRRVVRMGRVEKCIICSLIEEEEGNIAETRPPTQKNHSQKNLKLEKEEVQQDCIP